MRHPTLVLACLGGVLAAATVAALLLFWPVPSTTFRGETRMDVFVALVAVSAVAYLLAVGLVLRHPLPARAVWIVGAVALLLRAAILPAPTFLSSDIFRYIWDGRVQAAGVNPYLYIPLDPALSRLADPDILPNVNRREYARTIYPPGAQVLFFLIGRVTGTVTGVKLVMVLFEALAMGCMLRLLAGLGLPAARILIYAWNPLAFWSFACDGHVDAASIGLLAVALLLRARRRDGWAGAVLALATLIKFIPVAVAPAFVRGGRLLRPALAGAVVVVALYALYLSAGSLVLGYLPTYGTEERLDSGSGFWVLAGLSHLVAIPRGASAAYAGAVALLYAALSYRIVRREAASDTVALCRDTGVLAAFATAAISPHYAWYFPWLALPCVVAPVPAVVWLSSASVLLYVNPAQEWFFWPLLVYGPALLLALWSLRQPRPSPRVAAAPEAVG